MTVDLDNVSTASGEASISSSGNQTKPTPKRKRNLPGMPGTNLNQITTSKQRDQIFYLI